MKKITFLCVACLFSATMFAGNLRAALKTVNYDADTVDISEVVDYIQADYYEFEGQGYYTIGLMNYGESIPWLEMDVEAPSKTTLVGNYVNGANIDLDYCDLIISDEDTLDLTKAVMSIKCVNEDNGVGERVYRVVATVDAENGKVYTCDVTMEIAAYDEDESVIELTDTKTPDTPTQLEAVETLEVYARDGRIYAEEGARIYSINGLDVTRMNGNLNGAYIVKLGNKTQKVIVR